MNIKGTLKVGIDLVQLVGYGALLAGGIILSLTLSPFIFFVLMLGKTKTVPRDVPVRKRIVALYSTPFAGLMLAVRCVYGMSAIHLVRNTPKQQARIIQLTYSTFYWVLWVILFIKWTT